MLFAWMTMLGYRDLYVREIYLPSFASVLDNNIACMMGSSAEYTQILFMQLTHSTAAMQGTAPETEPCTESSASASHHITVGPPDCWCASPVSIKSGTDSSQ